MGRVEAEMAVHTQNLLCRSQGLGLCSQNFSLEYKAFKSGSVCGNMSRAFS